MFAPLKPASPRNRLLFIFAFFCLLAFSGCGGSLFKVQPVVTKPMPDNAKRSESGGLVVSASPLLTDEESQELFEANLPLNGILPIRIELANRSKGPIDLRKSTISVRNGDGEWRL